MAEDIEPIFTLVKPISLPLEAFAEKQRLTREKALLAGAKGVIRYAIAFTPPSSDFSLAKKQLTLQDRRQGERAIARDLYKIFTPIRLKHKRREEWPYPAQIHARLWVDGKVKLDRGRQFYHVDRSKFNLLYTELKSHVGFMAAGWVPAAAALSVAVPSWVARHNAPGSWRVEKNVSETSLVMTNSAVASARASEMRRRLPYAVRNQRTNMLAIINRDILQAAQEAGLEVIYDSAGLAAVPSLD